MARFRSIIFPLFFSVCLANPCLGAAGDLDLLTFNIRYGTAKDEGHTWELRRKAVIAVIDQASPDFFGLQEALEFQNQEIESNLEPRYVRIGEGREGELKGEFASLFYDADQFLLVRAGRFWLSDTPDLAGSKSWSGLPRIVTWIEVLERETSRRILVLNTHFAHDSEEARARSATLIVERIRELSPAEDTAVFLMGDFNCPPGSPPHQTLTGPSGKFLDTLIETRSREQKTFNGFKEPDSLEGKPIDWILFRGPVRPKTYQVLTEKVDGVIPSDHFPVRAVFEFLGPE